MTCSVFSETSASIKSWSTSFCVKPKYSLNLAAVIVSETKLFVPVRYLWPYTKTISLFYQTISILTILFFRHIRSKRNHYLKQISIQIQLKFSTLQFRQALGDGKTESASFCISGNISTDKSLRQFICREVQWLCRNIFKEKTTFLLLLLISAYTLVPSIAYFTTLPNTFSRTLHIFCPSA